MNSGLAYFNTIGNIEVLDIFFNSPSQVKEYLEPAGYNEAVGGAIDDALIIAIFNGIALWSHHYPWSPFTMNNLDGFSSKPRVEEIAFLYDSIFSGWPSRQNIVNHYNAVLDELGSLGSLEVLYLYTNELVGSIPPQLGNLSNLRTLGLGENRLTGTLPLELAQLGSLRYLLLSGNRLEGSIPSFLGDLANL